MKEGYIPKSERKNILLIADDLRTHSGVATVARELVEGTAHHYNWAQVGAAIKHPDEGKALDLSQAMNEKLGMTDSHVMIYPTSGYGNVPLLRQLIERERIDAIFIITDPRYYDWLFQAENELRRKVPIIYLNIWDDYPAPMYNKAFYESCDALLGISKQTVNINKLVLGDAAEGKVIEYVPHGLDPENYKPLPEDDKDLVALKKQLFGNDQPEFTLVFNSRNIRRKQIPDTIFAYKMFCDSIGREKAEKCAFVLKTNAVDQNGTDLPAVIDALCGDDPMYRIKIIDTRLDLKQMNLVYNLGDAQILLTSNEGWGLSLTEAILAGRPIIANTTGGMQDQMRFVDENGDWFTPSADVPSNNTGKYKECGEWAFPVYPACRSIQGSPATPYIWDDRCKPEDAAARIEEVYNLGKEERERRGLIGREWALSDEANFTTEGQANRVIEYVDRLFSTWTPREKYNIIKVENTKKARRVTHKLNY